MWIKRLAFVLFCFNLPKETLISYTSKMLEKDVQSPRGCGAALGSGLARPWAPRGSGLKGRAKVADASFFTSNSCRPNYTPQGAKESFLSPSSLPPSPNQTLFGGVPPPSSPTR